MDDSAVRDLATSRLPARIFLNYARADHEIADWLADRLRRAGAEVWMDRSDIRGGERWKEEIDRALWQRQFVVALLTRRSVAEEREWVHYEQERAGLLFKTIIPCLFEEAGAFHADDLLPGRLKPLDIVDFEPDREAGFVDLLDALRSRLRRYGKQLRNQAAGVAKFDRGLALDAADRNASLALCLQSSLEDIRQHDDERGTDWVSRYRALGVLPDGSRASAELLYALWGDPEDDLEGLDEADDALTGLCRRAMLRVDSKGLYFNHPVNRAYAAGLLRDEQAQLAAVHQRYRRWVIDRANRVYDLPRQQWSEHWLLIEHVQQVGRELFGEIKAVVGDLDRLAHPEPLEPEESRLLKTVDPGLLSSGLDFAQAVREFVIRRPEWGEEGLRSLRLGLVCARGTDSARVEVALLKRLGGALSTAEPELAGRYFSAALGLARETGDEAQQASILSYYGELERTRGNWQGALELLEQALVFHRQRGDLYMEAVTLKYMGEIAWRRTRFAEADEHYRKSIEIYRSLKQERPECLSGEADLYNKLGSLEFNRGHHELAIERFRTALALHEEEGNRTMMAEDKNDMGAAYRYLGDSHIALGLFEEAAQIDLEIGNRRHESIARSNMAGVLCDLGRFDESFEMAVEAAEIVDQVGDPVPRFWARCWQGTALRGRGRPDEAEEVFRQALEIVRSLDNPRGLAGVLGMLSFLLAERSEGRGEARRLLAEAVSVMEEGGFEQAFGGRRIEELRAALDALSPDV